MPNTPMHANKKVIQVGKYLYKNLDGAIRFKSSSNTYDVYLLVLYQLPRLMQIPGKQKEGYNDMHEMIVDINVTTYQNKVRVNIIATDEYEKTIGHKVFKPEELEDMYQAKNWIYQWVCAKLEKEYQEYIFLF